jgi:hypothetical protein
MDTELVLQIVENIVFWTLVLYIAWNENKSAPWTYIVLLVLIVYYALRFIFKKEGMDRIVWLYSLNMIVLIYLLFYFSRK